MIWPAAASDPSFHITLPHLGLLLFCSLNRAPSCLGGLALAIASAWNVYPPDQA